MSLHDWLISLSRMSSRFNLAVASTRDSKLFKIGMLHSTRICVNRHWGYFLMSVMDNVVMYLSVQIFLQHPAFAFWGVHSEAG